MKHGLMWRSGGKCEKCGNTNDLTVDHIIPLAWLKSFAISKEGSYEDLDLLQMLCKYCNASKADIVDWTNPRSKKILQRLLDDVPDYEERTNS